MPTHQGIRCQQVPSSPQTPTHGLHSKVLNHQLHTQLPRTRKATRHEETVKRPGFRSRVAGSSVSEINVYHDSRHDTHEQRRSSLKKTVPPCQRNAVELSSPPDGGINLSASTWRKETDGLMWKSRGWEKELVWGSAAVAMAECSCVAVFPPYQDDDDDDEEVEDDDDDDDEDEGGLDGGDDGGDEESDDGGDEEGDDGELDGSFGLGSAQN